MSDRVHLTALVHGKVQGVYYRAFASRAARSLSIQGSVKNVARGDVALEAEGDKGKLEELLRHLKTGPPGSMVGDIDIEWSEYTGQYTGFDVRY